MKAQGDPNYDVFLKCVLKGLVRYQRLMENMGKRFAKWKRMVRQQKGKLYIMRVCISMLLGWHKYSKATYMGSN
ncbi:uncharacterized protein LOC115949714 [Quercus lobata]|uniref:uncharacterized protein LOC115949714 n=1 Tax=Quercus lobata TaxID=97700 RepID=UPI001248DDF4|nr:uncharacterized protein LOC115949714 [Quercus lobata]